MDFFGNIFHILGMNGAVLLVPGVNFFLVAKYAITNGFRSSFQCVIGVTAAIMLHVMFAAFSVGAFLSSHPMIFNLIRFGGGLFLLYLGTRFFISSVKSKSLELVSTDRDSNGDKSAFSAGFFTDLLNPFVSIFYISLFSSIKFGETYFFELLIYGTVILLITIVWFGIISAAFSRKIFKSNFQAKTHIINFLSGMAMYYFGLKVLFDF